MRCFVQATWHKLYKLLVLDLKVWNRTLGFGISEYWITKKHIFIYHYWTQDFKFLLFLFLLCFPSWEYWQQTTKLVKYILEVNNVCWLLCKQFIFVDHYPEWKPCKRKSMYSMNCLTLNFLFTCNKKAESDKKIESSQSE